MISLRRPTTSTESSPVGRMTPSTRSRAFSSRANCRAIAGSSGMSTWKPLETRFVSMTRLLTTLKRWAHAIVRRSRIALATTTLIAESRSDRASGTTTSLTASVLVTDTRWAVAGAAADSTPRATSASDRPNGAVGDPESIIETVLHIAVLTPRRPPPAMGEEGLEPPTSCV